MPRSLFSALDACFNAHDPVTRREAVKATLGIGTALLLSSGCGIAGSPRLTSNGRVTVIGGGLAGLTAAYELNSVKYDVTVVEARQRLSGRVLSDRNFVEGKCVEGGGEFIGANHPTWLAYAAKFGLKLVDVTEFDDARKAIFLQGKRLHAEEATILWKEMRAALAQITKAAATIDASRPWTSPDAAQLDRQSVASWLSGLDTSKLCKLALASQFTTENGVIPSRQSYLGTLAYIKGGALERYWSESEVYRCSGGNQQLADQLGAAIGAGRVILNAPVTGITLDNESAVVTLADGRKLSSEDVILATPPTTWRNIAFEPQLPLELRPQMGSSIKLLLAVKNRFWKRKNLSCEALTDGPVGHTWEATDMQDGDEHACVTLFTGGPSAESMCRLAPDERFAIYMREVDKLFPGIRHEYATSRFMGWPNDPWARAGYACAGPGEVTAIGPILHKGLGRLHFAGDYACYDFQGFMEGALQSGVTVARKLAKRDGVIFGETGSVQPRAVR